MKRANSVLIMGITGLMISSVMMIIGRVIGSKFDFLPLILPFLVYLLLGLSKKLADDKK